ncbi:thiol:disulfide interchange protein [Salmonella enterica subsp. enterica serovar Daytona]|uniref:Thiol:disulfide interchange protein n=1 Tax=Salmonella enterica subsp. enterica serovar Daytona TaxID=1962639 RepID=A0A447JCV6_SALET|nr:thiol:disulfide interchange protein [Salmonella enterica subsp. enterica serovar Daytona]
MSLLFLPIITCGYCHKLHEEMKDYNALGITVRYLAFPRPGAGKPGGAGYEIYLVRQRQKQSV